MSAGSSESKTSPVEDAVATKATPALSISPEKICFIVVNAREFDAKEVVIIRDEASNATDDAMMSVLEDHADDPVAAELRGFIGALTEGEQARGPGLARPRRRHARRLGGPARGSRSPAEQAHGLVSAGNAAAARSSGGCALPVRPLVRRVRSGTSIGQCACKAPSRSTSKE
jgi:hypothetical protein